MSEINKGDLKTILSLALHLARVDEDLAEFEQEILDRFAEVIGLSDDEKAALADKPVQLTDQLEELSGGESKEFLVKTLCAVAYSDGIQHEAEIEFIRKVNTALGEPLDLLPWADWESYVLEVIETLGTVK